MRYTARRRCIRCKEWFTEDSARPYCLDCRAPNRLEKRFLDMAEWDPEVRAKLDAIKHDEYDIRKHRLGPPDDEASGPP